MVYDRVSPGRRIDNMKKFTPRSRLLLDSLPGLPPRAGGGVFL